MRVAIGGMVHETNTFALVKTDFQQFAMPDVWPGLTRGADILNTFKGNNGLAGALGELQKHKCDIVPLMWAFACPGAHVTDDAFERMAAMIINDLIAALPVDGVFLELHGAMVTESHEDPEGELLRRVRAVIGPDIPLVACMDFHANITPLEVASADLIEVYRAYPHIDMGETGARAARHLIRFVEGHGPRKKAFRQLPFIIPINSQCTDFEPAKYCVDRLRDISNGDVRSISFAFGFPLADIWDCGPSILAYADDEETAERALNELLNDILDREAEFKCSLLPPDQAVQQAISISKTADCPVIISDTQDNCGCGSESDTMGMFRALLNNKAQGAVVAIVVDAEVAAQAHAAGKGAVIHARLGEKSGWAGGSPFEGDFTIEEIGDGNFVATGPMWGGSEMKLGKMALLEHQGIRVIVGSVKFQAGDQSIFRHLGLEPSKQHILVLKSSVHFRNDFSSIAEDIIIAGAPGPVIGDPTTLDWKNLRPGMRTGPLGPTFKHKHS